MTFFRLFALMLLCGSLVCLSSPASKAAADVEPLLVVVGLAFPGTNISYASLKSAFRGQPIDLSGQRVVPVNHPLASPLRTDFDRLVLKLVGDQVGRFWVDMRIRDQGRPPTTAPSPEMAVRMITGLPGAVTYTTKAFLTPKVKVLSVDDKTAGEHGYPLQP